MEPHHHHHQHHQHHHLRQQQQQHHLQHALSHQSMINTTGTSTSGGAHVEGSDRFPQWSMAETKEFLMTRAELDQRFMETKRNKKLWELISQSMNQKGYYRSADQCKCKWKNLVTRYKGCETMEAEAMRQQFPFYNELQAIFTARMERMVWAEAEESSKKKAKNQSSDEEEDGNNNNEESEDQKGVTRKKKKAKIVGSGDNNSNILSNFKEILEEFMRQQMQMEAQWMEAFEAREKERRAKEMEWRQAMQALENERIMMDQRWREREEQRRVREEARAERRDALITALLDKLAREEEMY